MEQAKLEAPTEYGSDKNGLVWGYRFQTGSTATLVTSDQVAAELAIARDDATFYWLHFSLANAGTERWLRQHAGLPEAYYTEFHAPSSATRVEQDGDALVAVINDVALDFQNDVADVSPVTLGVRPGLMVSARLKPLRSIDRLREWVRSHRECRSPVALLTRLLENQAVVLAEIVRKSHGRVDAIEDSVFTSRVGGNRAELSALRRQLVRMQRLLAPEPGALFRLLNRPPPWMTEEDTQQVRQSAEDFAAVVADCTALVERGKLIQEELTAMVNEQTNRSLFLLTVVTVMLLPFNVVGGLFGMNVGGIPFATDAEGFWVVIFIVTVLTALVWRVLARRFRR